MNMGLQQSKEQGTTLVEVLITMGLLSIFMVVLTTIITACFDIQSRNDSYASVTNDGQFALSRLDYDIRRASEVDAVSTSSLSLTIAGNNYTYTVNNNRLALTVNGDTSYLTNPATEISALSFQKLGSGAGQSIRYTFTLSSKSAHDSQNQSYTSTTGLRP
jgi:type II secretory pathway pseudopilin PulG